MKKEKWLTIKIGVIHIDRLVDHIALFNDFSVIEREKLLEFYSGSIEEETTKTQHRKGKQEASFNVRKALFTSICSGENLCFWYFNIDRWTSGIRLWCSNDVHIITHSHTGKERKDRF